MKTALLPALIALLLAIPVTRATAHDEPVMPGRITLQAQADAEIDNDTLRAVLFSEAEDGSVAKAADTVNRAIAEAGRLARAQAGVQVRSAGYQTYPVYDKQNRISRWRVRADMQLEGSDFKGMAALLARLQGTLALAGMDFFASREARRRVEDSVTTAALADFRRRAEVSALALGAKGFRILEIALNADGGPPPPAMMSARAGAPVADMAPPPTDGGTTRVGVFVTGTVVATGLQD